MSKRGIVKNGKRVVVDHPSANGLGGFVQANGKHVLAYPKRPGSSDLPQVGTELQVEGTAFLVATVAQTSVGSLKMVRLGLTPA